MINFHQDDESYQIVDFSSKYRVFLTKLNLHHNDDFFTSKWWIFIKMMTFHHIDCLQLKQLIFITLMNFIILTNFHHNIRVCKFFKNLIFLCSTWKKLVIVHTLIDKIDLGSFHDDLGTYIWHFIFTRELPKCTIVK